MSPGETVTESHKMTLYPCQWPGSLGYNWLVGSGMATHEADSFSIMCLLVDPSGYLLKLEGWKLQDEERA